MITCRSCDTKQIETSKLCSKCGAALSPEIEVTVAASPNEAPEDSGNRSSPTGLSYDDLHTKDAVFVHGTAPHIGTEIESVLRRRLRGATLVLLMGHAAFSVFMFLVDIPHYPSPPFLNAYHAFVVFFLVVCGCLLFRPGRIPLRRLRRLELLIFGVSTLNFSLMDYVSIMHCAPKGFVQNPASYWGVLILLYGIFIPNTWRRAAAVVSAMFVISLAMTVFLKIRYDFVAEALSWVQVSFWAMQELVACAGAIIGAHVINTLRRQAFEAKQLGQYRLKRRIGSGGMGEVYLGEHRLLKRPCAIKVIRPGKAADPTSLARFERETQTTAELSHPNTIEVYDHGRTEDGTFYYVMEYLPGLSLEQLVNRHGPMHAARVVYLLKQVCGALCEAHGVGLIHRDIKPDNIFSARRGGRYDVAKLLDFGLVKPHENSHEPALTQEGAISGTPSYMSPEQATGDGEQDVRSDIYSLGAVAYFLLTGRPPFERDTSMKVLIAHARDDVVPPSEIRSDVPHDLEQVVLRCLAKNRDQRFQNTASLEAAFSDCESDGQWSHQDATQWWEESELSSVDAGPIEASEGGKDSIAETMDL